MIQPLWFRGLLHPSAHCTEGISMTLNDELNVIDETIAELEGRRAEIINRITDRVSDADSSHQDSAKILSFPNRVRVRKHSTIPGEGWPIGTKP
jgi:hypothetical protein